MPHRLSEMTITIGAPAHIGDEAGRRVLARFYGTLLGLQVIDDDWLRIAEGPGSALRFALDGDGWSDLRPPRFGDPEHPQQVHLDLQAPDAAATSRQVLELGGSLLADLGDWCIYADPAGHPFCLDPDPDGPGSGRGVVMTRLVFDCYSPRSLAAFYEGFLGVSDRPEDTPERVEVALGDERFPNLLFQHAQCLAPRWPDPAYPAQMHVDFRFVEGKDAAIARAETLGAIRLPKLSDAETYGDPAGHPFCV